MGSCVRRACKLQECNTVINASYTAGLTHIQHATQMDGLVSEIGQTKASSPLLCLTSAPNPPASLDNNSSRGLGHEFRVVDNDDAKNDELEYLAPVAPSHGVAMDCNQTLQYCPLDIMDWEEGDQH